MAGKTNGRRNRSAGKQWERDIIKRLKERGIYPHACSTRSESRNLDGCGIDVMNKNEVIVGMMNDSIQAKSEARQVTYPKHLSRIRAASRPHPVVFHRQTAKSGTRFMVRDEFAICYVDTYIELMACRELIIRLKKLLPNVDVVAQKAIQQELAKLGLQ